MKYKTQPHNNTKKHTATTSARVNNKKIAKSNKKSQKAIEIEIKTLLGEKSKAEELVQKLLNKYQKTSLKKKSKQLNHYFIGGNYDVLFKKISPKLPREKAYILTQIIKEGQKHSTRTRFENDTVILVIKATIDETTSENGTARIEFEHIFTDIMFDELDKLLLTCEFDYQAKWSREREEYIYKHYSVSIDKNAGYGYLAEFERVVQEGEDIELIKKEIRQELEELGLEELPQDRLARMFKHYNENWKNYYGTEKTFILY
jgi:adenylate cyclase class IV